MRRLSGLFVVLAILLSGLVSMSYFARASEHSRRQLYSDAADSTLAQVTIQNFAFNPDEIYVRAGTVIRWMNQDGVSHTVTSDDGSFDSGTLLSGESFEHRFDVPGTYTYFCSIHPSMRGTVTVFDPSLDVFVPIVLK